MTRGSTLGLDVGSSGVKALRVGSSGRVIASARLALATRRGRGGRVEHDPEAVLAAAVGALAGAVARSGGRLGIATQRSTVLFWDRDSGRPLTPAYSWQDLRGRALCDRIRGAAARIREATGLRLSPHYAASKLAWALWRVPGLRRQAASGSALWGTLGTFLVWRLSRGSAYVMDHANAQRTLLFDLGALDWDPALFATFGLNPLLDAPARPALVPTFLAGEIEIAFRGGRPRLAALTGDQQAAMLGLGCRRRGDVAINYGSGAFVLRHAGAERPDAPRLLATLLASWPSTAVYAAEGTVNAAGTAIEWAQERLGLRVRSEDLDGYLDGGGPGRRDVFFLPAVAGTGAPRWDPSARPRFAGGFRDASPRDLLRAVVESIAMRCAEILRTAGGAAAGAPVLVSGGLARCRSLLQAQADLLQRPILVREQPEATALGAALLARRAPLGRIPRGGRPSGRLVRPRISRDEAEARYAAWERAVGASRRRR